MEERRGHIRQRTLKGGRIVVNTGYSTFQCTVRNMSDVGAKLVLASVVGIGDAFELVMDDGRKFDCTVAWRNATELGVHFAAS